ncbi:MAG: Hsp20/alpha crystallin family protein [Chloroflexota bacterium]
MRYQRLTVRLLRAAPVDPRPPMWPERSGPLAFHRWRPPVDVCETAAGITVTLEVAGLIEDRTDVSVYEDALVIDGERSVPGCGADGRYHVAEIRQGAFHVEIVLPDRFDASGVTARYDGGLLRVELPAQAKPRRRRTPTAAPAAR